MKIDIEFLDKQIDGLVEQTAPLTAQLNMLQGAIQALTALKTKLLEEKRIKEEGES